MRRYLGWLLNGCLFDCFYNLTCQPLKFLPESSDEFGYQFWLRICTQCL